MMSGQSNSLCARKLFESEVITSLLHNSESWIEIKDDVQLLQEFQNKFMSVIAARQQGDAQKGYMN